MPATKQTFQHPQFGPIIVTRNPRARRIIMRARPDAIYITLPTAARESDIERALEQHGGKLKELRQNIRPAFIDKNFAIETRHFKLCIREDSPDGIRITGKEGAYTIHCTRDFDYSGEGQPILENAAKMALRHCASLLLPKRLKELAGAHGFTFSSCSVRDSHSRWGSCSSRGSINLSIYLLLLPEELIDYVLLHELCHTVEMNHSERFWSLLDRHTAPAHAKALRNCLKDYKVGLFPK